MKRIAILIAVALPLCAQEDAKFAQVMKDMASASGQVRKALEAKTSKEDVASGGEKLVALYKEVEEFWTKRGVADAIEMSKKGAEASKELANPGGIAPAQAALGRVSETCKTCHAAHREKTEAGYKIK